jgi:hypothetical protein
MGGENSGHEMARAAFGGVVAAMAMTGMRLVTTQLGLVEEEPPEAILEQKAPEFLNRVPVRYRPVVIEFAHWLYGGLSGLAFGLLPRALRNHRWSGPAYGLVTWLGFEAGIAPALGLEQARRPRFVERLTLAIDHAMYGVIVARTRPSPEGYPESTAAAAGSRSPLP